MAVTICRLPLRVVVLMVSAVMAGHTGWRELAAYLSLARLQLGWSLAWLGHAGKWLSGPDGRVVAVVIAIPWTSECRTNALGTSGHWIRWPMFSWAPTDTCTQD
uniref:Uncharacterized protein n=1 Tax=Oryza sativa subsp. japonica TaxID=39947 RepID=Q6YX58_ORYSJ|nr:hypothetical protein [Oryza sativa Japonica Group]